MNFNQVRYSLSECVCILRRCFSSNDTDERTPLELLYSQQLKPMINDMLAKEPISISDKDRKALEALMVLIDIRLAKRNHPRVWEMFRPKKSDRVTCLERDGYKCVHCGEANARLEVDHIKEICDGGTHEQENLQTLCRPCHRIKTNKARAHRKSVIYPQ